MKTFKKPLFSIIFGIVLAGVFSSLALVFAVPPDSAYNPGDTLDPNCAVGSANCTVNPPAGTANTLTSGRVPYVTTGGLLTDSALLKFDSAAGSLGVGLSGSIPEWSSLYVYKASGAVYSVVASGDNLAAHSIISNNNDSFFRIQDSGTADSWYVGSDYSDSQKLKIGWRENAGGQPGDNDLLTITTDGNVGIGTASPVGELTIDSGANNADFYIQNDASGNAGTDGFTFQLDNLGAVYLWNREDANMYLGTNGTSRMMIQNDGKIGVGTNTPGALLDVGLAGTTLGTMRLEGNTSGYVQIQPAAAAGSWTMTLPANDGDNGQVLTTNGSGVTSWTAAGSGSPGGANTQVQYNNNGAFGGSANLTFDGTSLTSAGLIGPLKVSSTTGVNLTAINGVLTMAGLKAASNNENLTFDFETTSNTVGVGTGTGVTDLDFGSLNFTTNGIGTFNGGVVTLYDNEYPPDPLPPFIQGGIMIIRLAADDHRIYFGTEDGFSYVAQTGGFTIPNFEKNDPISGEEIKEGDIVLGTINKTQADGAKHGLWTKWDTVKGQLFSELNIELSDSGTLENGQPKMTPIFTNLSVKKSNTDIARIKKMEMVDEATGEIYCAWISNGEWMKAKGECGNASPSVIPEQSGIQLEVVENTLDSRLRGNDTADNGAENSQNLIPATVSPETASLASETPAPSGEINPVLEASESSQSNVSAELQPETITPTAPEATVGDLLQNATSSLMDGIKNFVDKILGFFGW